MLILVSKSLENLLLFDEISGFGDCVKRHFGLDYLIVLVYKKIKSLGDD